MVSTRIKVGAFLLEGLNSLSTTYYFYYIFFFLKDRFGFGSRENLYWAIAQGAVYVVAAWQGGRFGQRRGYLHAIRLGFAGMLICFLGAWVVAQLGISRQSEILWQGAWMIGATISICLTWPNLEAIVSEGETTLRLQRMVGIYNLIWAGGAALAYFTGGALIELLGAPHQIFLVPGLMMSLQWGIATWLTWQPEARLVHPKVPSPSADADHAEIASTARTQRKFLWMAWLSNPCAYLAIATAIPLIPTLADRLGLSPRTAGFFCSIWLFTRVLTFVGLWRWTGWHYRFRWLVLAFVGMIAGFLFLFLSEGILDRSRLLTFTVATAAQLVFGISIGIIYYSSLFYSMDVGDTKGDHGGIHEAAIGLGLLGGPLVGAVAASLVPGRPTAAVEAVSVLLCLGFAGLFSIRFGRRPAKS